MTTKRGGPNRGQGRKPLAEGDPTVTVCVKMPRSLEQKLGRISGESRSEWVRDQVKKAKET